MAGLSFFKTKEATSSGPPEASFYAKRAGLRNRFATSGRNV
ncbi:MAG: hypothetical protein ACKVOB_02605 [Sphingomonas sp.]